MKTNFYNYLLFALAPINTIGIYQQLPPTWMECLSLSLFHGCLSSSCCWFQHSTPTLALHRNAIKIVIPAINIIIIRRRCDAPFRVLGRWNFYKHTTPPPTWIALFVGPRESESWNPPPRGVILLAYHWNPPSKTLCATVPTIIIVRNPAKPRNSPPHRPPLHRTREEATTDGKRDKRMATELGAEINRGIYFTL